MHSANAGTLIPMKCPADGTTLLMSERQGIEIDYCPDCRGVWLDRGELDKILEKARAESEEAAPAPPLPPAPPTPVQAPSVAPPSAAPPVPPMQPPVQPPPAQAPGNDPRFDPRGYGDRGREGDPYGQPRYDDREHRGYEGGYDRRADPRYRKKKRMDWLGDLFD